MRLCECACEWVRVCVCARARTLAITRPPAWVQVRHDAQPTGGTVVTPEGAIHWPKGGVHAKKKLPAAHQTEAPEVLRVARGTGSDVAGAFAAPKPGIGHRRARSLGTVGIARMGVGRGWNGRAHSPHAHLGLPGASSGVQALGSNSESGEVPVGRFRVRFRTCRVSVLESPSNLAEDLHVRACAPESKALSQHA